MDKEDKIKFIIISLGVACLFELFLFIGALDIINDKTAYINGLLSDRKICNDKLDSITNDYERLSEENG